MLRIYGSASCDITYETGIHELLRVLASISCDITYETKRTTC